MPPELPALTAAALGSAAIALLGGAAPRRRASGPAGGRIGLLGRAGARVRAPVRASSDLADRIAAAGRPAGLGVRELLGAKLALALAAGALAAPLSTLAPGRLGLLLVAATPAAAFLGPDLWLARRAAARTRAVRRELPAMLDLLRVGVEAGLSLPAALAAVGERAHGPLAAEWRAVSREVELGVPLGDALRELTRRLPLPELRALVAALERSRRHGAPLAETLAAQARDARFALRRRVREEAGRAGPKIQLVVALLLVPSVLLLVAAALVAALLDTDGMLPV